MFPSCTTRQSRVSVQFLELVLVGVCTWTTYALSGTLFQAMMDRYPGWTTQEAGPLFQAVVAGAVVAEQLHRKHHLLVLSCVIALFPVLWLVMFYALFWMATSVEHYMYTLPIMLLYVGWFYLVDKDVPFQGGRSVRWFKELRFFDIAKSYYPPALEFDKGECKIDPNELYAFGVHPHGILSVGVYANFVWCRPGSGSLQEQCPGLEFRILTIRNTFYIPLWREFQMALGFIDASRKAIDPVFQQGNSIVLVPGGAAEVSLGKPRAPVVLLQKRKGFIKMAIENGASLVPCYTFGESELFEQADSNPESIIVWLQGRFRKMSGFTVPFFKTLFPKQTKITTIVGEPIPVIKQQKPPQEVIDQVHARYVGALKEMYTRHHKRFGYAKELGVM